MFIGHYAVGCAGRATAPGPSLGTWFMAVQWLDLVWPVLVLTGIERLRIEPGDTAVTPLNFVHYPWSHSLLLAILWGVLFGAVYRWRTGQGRAAVWVGAGVVSHWVLDWVTHRPDLPLWPGGPLVGLGLWNTVLGTVVVEGALFALAVAMYARVTRPLDRTGHYAWWALVGFLAVVYAANLLGPPPPSETAVAVSALSLWLLVAWGYWVDRHRQSAH